MPQIIIKQKQQDLLNNLYSRVVQSEIENINDNPSNTNFLQEINQQVNRRNVKLKKQIYHLPQLQQEPKFSRPQDRQNNRPNHIFYQSKPQFLKERADGPPSEVIERRKNIRVLNDKLKQQAYQLEKILSSMDARDYLQLRFAIQYDQNKLTEKLLSVFMIIADVHTREQLAYEYDLKTGLESLTVNNLNDLKVKTINEMIRGDKRLTLDSISKQNEALGPLFGFIQILMRSYDNGKQLRKLQENEKQYQLFQQYQQSVQMGIVPEFYSQNQQILAQQSQLKQQQLSNQFSQNQMSQQMQNNIQTSDINIVDPNMRIPENMSENLLQSSELMIKTNKMQINQNIRIKKQNIQQ